MQPRWRAISRMVIICVALGAVPALFQVVFGRTTPGGFAESTMIGCLYSICIGVPCWVMAPRAMRALRNSSFHVRLAATVALFGVFAFTGCLVANLLLVATGLSTFAHFGRVYWWSLRVCLVITYTFGFLSFTIATLQSRLSTAKEQLQQRQIGEERQRKIAAEARLASLESRVRPHFLFNTLNSISALVRENPAEAERMIERLSALLRYSLDTEVTGLVPLREELRVVGEYLGIEQVRFGDRLRFRIDAPDEALALLVPALSVQTLVENSVKYAVGAARNGAEILVSANLSNGTLRVEVSDDGPGFETGADLKPGHGLDLLKRRLDSLFGAAASLDMNASGGRTTVAISVTA
jgi:sensor histidine kinase YesM